MKAAELAYSEPKVLHPATVTASSTEEYSRLYLNSGNPECEGTRITARAPSAELFQGHAG